jgi:hypothetical protein
MLLTTSNARRLTPAPLYDHRQAASSGFSATFCTGQGVQPDHFKREWRKIMEIMIEA